MRTEGEASEPEREPLRFHINVDGASQDVVEVLLNVKKVAERVLWHWKTFPIALPPPIAVVQDAENPGRKKPICMRDLFVAPSFDEMDSVAIDAKGQPRKLTYKQLQCVREEGEFEVESLNFSGQVHRWRLSQLLQKGTRKAHETLLDDTALAVGFIVVTAKNRIHSHFFSVSQSLATFGQGLLQLLDVVFGVPSLCARDLDSKIREERCKYLVAEMVVRPTLEEDLDNLCQFIKQQIRKQKVEKYRIEQENPPPVPYLFQTPKGIEIDLRLFNREVMKKSLPVLAGILEREARGWFLQFREKTIADLKIRKLTDEEIERQANLAIMDEYLRRVYHTIMSHPDLICLGPGLDSFYDDGCRSIAGQQTDKYTVLHHRENATRQHATRRPRPTLPCYTDSTFGQLLVEHAQSIILMHRAVENVQNKLNHSQSQLKTTLQEKNPVLSRIGTWLRDKLRDAEDKFIIEHMWSAHEEALSLCRDHQLEQTIYFLQRDLAFMKEREPILLQELSRVKIPTRVFHWRIQIWCPRNWVVTRVHQGESEVVRTVVNKVSTTSSTRSNPNEPRYLVEKQVTKTTSTRWPFWRWTNYFYRTFTWLCNAMFIFGVVIPWCSPVSLRALLSIEPFMPDLEPNSEGILVPRKSSVTQTLCSRLTMLWRHISKSRTEFESRPDTGFIGKGFTRHMNRLWNYVLKGFCGTIAIVLVFPALCLLVSITSLAIGALAILWVPIGTFGFHLACVLVYDFDNPDALRNRWLLLLEAFVWRILIQGCLQPIAALLIAGIACPAICLAILTVAVARRSCRTIWDTLMFHAVIKKRGRIPASDSFVARRIAGPGLESKYYYQIRSEQALAAFEAKMEIDELTAYRDEMEHLIQEPQDQFSRFVSQCFLPFSAALVKEGVFKQLEKEAFDLSSALKEKVDKRKRELQTGLNITVRSKIKLTARELKLTIKQASIMLENFYPNHVLKRLHVSEEDFWENKGLALRDWPGLAGLIFSEIFSQEFLTPLEDVDTRFRLEVQHMNLFRYAEMLRTAEYRDDLDVVSTVHTPKGKVQVHSPFMDVSTFNPLSKKNSTTHKSTDKKKSTAPWKRKHTKYNAEKLWIPLPIPHPAHISVIIYNRENEDPIPLEEEQCQAILRAVEDASMPGYEYISIDLTPPDSQSLTSLGADNSFVSGNIHDNDYQPHRPSNGGGDAAAAMRRSVSLDPDTATVDDRSSSRLSGSINVNLASSEDITMEADGERVTYSHSSYSTTV